MITLCARTVGELKEVLSDVPDDSFWFGCDDGSIYIQELADGYWNYSLNIENGDND